jgi:hypothetical protein
MSERTTTDALETNFEELSERDQFVAISAIQFMADNIGEILDSAEERGATGDELFDDIDDFIKTTLTQIYGTPDTTITH